MMPTQYVEPVTFKELAEELIYGFSVFHKCSNHTPDECSGWQKGIEDFAVYLDECHSFKPKDDVTIEVRNKVLEKIKEAVSQ
jgi:hypothetical protein